MDCRNRASHDCRRAVRQEEPQRRPSLRGYVHLHNREWGVFACPGKHRPNPSTKPDPDHHRIAADPDPDSGAVPDPDRCRPAANPKSHSGHNTNTNTAADPKPQSESNTRADTVADS